MQSADTLTTHTSTLGKRIYNLSAGDSHRVTLEPTIASLTGGFEGGGYHSEGPVAAALIAAAVPELDLVLLGVVYVGRLPNNVQLRTVIVYLKRKHKLFVILNVENRWKVN